ncbi:TetR/AcrR family transcriptional regulator [Anaerobacillus alkaliphilus]|uniref:TetR/AcrR family transcriptional regulator n=1 Tax=Anaerobacillus alkaliphilus TaxID=1548597 RepID=A0A4Q0VUS3_9BACI|nr:TetR-like C-terminal domain-containing protein [Anaerobacillus alkaliphilus]RXJ00268.1 TetR/AcrR family transcriptional regulator [Anaerobacillus alkaliphilus]
MTAKLDRRKKYTRMVLRDSLMTLLKEKQISAITVKELCELADINRSTYYSHYSDQFDLLNKIEEEIIEDMYGKLSQFNCTKEDEALQMTEKILEYIASKSDVCQTLLSEHGDTNFQKRIMNITQQFTMKNWMTINNVDPKITEYISMFVVSGCISVIKSWLENGMDKSPKEMAEIINNFSNKGLSSIFLDEHSS